MKDHFQYATLGAVVALLIVAIVILSITNSTPVQLHDVLVAAIGGLLGVSVPKGGGGEK